MTLSRSFFVHLFLANVRIKALKRRRRQSAVKTGRLQLALLLSVLAAMPTALRVSTQGAQVSQHLRLHQPLQAAALREDPSEVGIAPGHQLIAPGHQLIAPGHQVVQLALLLSALARRPAVVRRMVQLPQLTGAVASRRAAMRRAAGRLQPVQTNRFRAHC